MSTPYGNTKKEEILENALRHVLINLNYRKSAKTCMLALDDDELAVEVEMALEKARKE